MTSYLVYLLVNSLNNCTYIGITNNKERRIRQHNGELVGGARYTTKLNNKGVWKYYGWLELIDEELIVNRALSLEKKIKIRSKKSKCKLPLEKRLDAIDSLLIENPDLKLVIA